MTEMMDRVLAAMNAHDIDAFVACFATDYRSEQPAHPDRAFSGQRPGAGQLDGRLRRRP